MEHQSGSSSEEDPAIAGATMPAKLQELTARHRTVAAFIYRTSEHSQMLGRWIAE